MKKVIMGCDSTISRWIARKNIRAIGYMKTNLVPKEDVINL